MNWSFSVSSCNKCLLQTGIICLNLVRIWYIFPTSTFVLNAVKEPGTFLGVGGCVLIKAFWTVSQWVNASPIAFNTNISPTHTPCKIVESRRDLSLFYKMEVVSLKNT